MADPKNSLPEYNDVPGFQIPNAEYPAAQENIKRAMQKQLQLANDYKANAPGMVNAQANIFNQGERASLKQGIRQTREGFNQRGLLKSGMRQGAEFGQKAAAQSDMANNRYGLNQQATAAGNQLEQNAVNSGLLYAGNAPGIGTGALSGQTNANNTDIANSNAAGSLYGAGGDALAKLTSAIWGNNKSSGSNNYNFYGGGGGGGGGGSGYPSLGVNTNLGY